MPQSQPVNSSQVDGLSSQFQRRWESVYHWRSMCSMLLGTPGLRAAWPMSSVDFAQPECIDISGQGNHLQAAALGNVVFGRAPTGIAPGAFFGGAANQYLTRADGGAGNWADVLGTENYIAIAQRGLTMGGWFWLGVLPSFWFVGLMTKADGVTPQYRLVLDAANQVRFEVWPGPVAVVSAAAMTVGWNHCTGIYDQPSQTLFVELNGVITAGAAGAAPAALVDTAVPFVIGADGVGANRFTGWGSDCFLSAASLSQGFVRAGYHYTKAAYGVK